MATPSKKIGTCINSDQWVVAKSFLYQMPASQKLDLINKVAKGRQSRKPALFQNYHFSIWPPPWLSPTHLKNKEKMRARVSSLTSSPIHTVFWFLCGLLVTIVTVGGSTGHHTGPRALPGVAGGGGGGNRKADQGFLIRFQESKTKKYAMINNYLWLLQWLIYLQSSFIHTTLSFLYVYSIQ